MLSAVRGIIFSTSLWGNADSGTLLGLDGN